MEYNFRIYTVRWRMSKSTKVALAFFCASSSHFRDINVSNLLPSKNKSRSRSTIFAITPLDGKCQNLQWHFFTFLIFAKFRTANEGNELTNT